MSATWAKFGIRIGCVGLLAAAGLGLSACADLGRATGIIPIPISTSSAVAAQVQQATHTSYPRPSFRDVPAKPKDIRGPGAYRTVVAENQRARNQLDKWIAANPPLTPLDPTQIEAFAANQRAMIPAGETTPVVPVGSDDYAARLRELATPPSPPK